MKALYLGFICLFLFSSCKSETGESSAKEEVKELSVAEKIANAHGFENWKNVNEVKFTFQVDRDTIKGNGRSWTWEPKSDKVTLTAQGNTIAYMRSQMDSTKIAADRAFINDKFWFLVPFQLVWDTSATISEPQEMDAPISKTPLNMITITYPNEGGYTPGDAYDIYYGGDYLIKEWVYRRGNAEAPSLATTFENYNNYNGIKIATDHKQEGGNWNLNFTDVKISMD